MISGFYNRFTYMVLNGSFNPATATVKVMLLRSTGSYTFNPDHDTVAEVLSAGAVEISVASYGRQELANLTASLVDASDISKVDCDNIPFGALESGQQVSGVLYYIEVTDDSDSIPILYENGKVDIVVAAPVSAPATGNITGVTNANPCVVTSANHGRSNGDKVQIASVGGTTQLNGNVYTVANATTNTFELSGVNSSSYGTYTSGGTWKLVPPVYIEPLDLSIKDGASLDFGSSITGNVHGQVNSGARVMYVKDLSGALSAGGTSPAQTTMNLPTDLGNGDFTINIHANGFYYMPSYPNKVL